MEMKKRGLASAELARRADVLTSFIYDVISGKSSNPSTVKLARVADALGTSLTYLVRGVDTNTDISAPDATKKEKHISIPRLALASSASNSENNTISHKYIEENEPYYFNREWISTHLNTNASNLRIFTINGDSMEPTLLHQDIVLIDTSRQTPSPPSIFVIFDGIGLTAKRLEHLAESGGSQIRVISDNQHYSSYECSISDISIIGRVVWFSREM